MLLDFDYMLIINNNGLINTNSDKASFISRKSKIRSLNIFIKYFALFFFSFDPVFLSHFQTSLKTTYIHLFHFNFLLIFTNFINFKVRKILYSVSWCSLEATAAGIAVVILSFDAAVAIVTVIVKVFF